MKGSMWVDPVGVETAGSWWIDAPYCAMTQTALAHLPRMASSRFGKTDTLAIGSLGETAGERLNRAARTKRMRDGFTWAAGQ